MRGAGWLASPQGSSEMHSAIRIACVAAVLVPATLAPAAAHPLGNFTVNHLSRITTTHDGLRVRYALDLAEIPTFSLSRSLDPHGTPSDAVLSAWARSHASETAPQLVLTVDERRVALTPLAWTVQRRPGAGGLPTLSFSVLYAASVAPGAHRLAYRDGTAPGRVGWKDVVIGDAIEPTNDLRSYPNALAGSPRDRTTIVAQVDATGRISAEANAVAGDTSSTVQLGRSNALSDLLSKGASDPLIIIGALLLAVALGALHALEPGHGKTLLAVSLLGARATPRQALILASALTVAHTAGVLVLGVVVLLAAQWVVPEQIYPWITLGSGAFVTILGARAVARQVRIRLPRTHEHGHAHEHVHAIPGNAPLTFGNAVLAAASGNIAPCPAALVVLLAAIALHQVGYGLALIVAFSIGLAVVLTALGVAVVGSASWLVERPQFDAVARVAPLVTAFAIAGVGAVMVGQSFAAQGIGAPAPLVAVLVLAAVLGYAFASHRHRSSAEAHA
jgi:nickel/cobalt exporter